MKKLNFSS